MARKSGDGEGVAIASILNVFLKWMSKGNKTNVRHASKEYKAVSLKNGVSIVRNNEFGLTARIHTKNGDTVYMTIPKRKPKDSFDTFDMARKLVSAGSSPSSYEKVIFPMIDLDAKPDISWLKGLSDETRGDGYFIDEALQETKVKMDEVGVKVQEAVAIHATKSARPRSRPPFIIDEPFLFAIHRKGLKDPFFSAYLNLDGWRTERGNGAKSAKSVVGSFYTMSNAVDKLHVKEWTAYTPKQEKFLEIYKNTAGAKIPEIKSMVGSSAQINAFLKSSKFGIQLEHGLPGGHVTWRRGKNGRVLVGFYKERGKTKPITRSTREMNRKKVVKHSKQFRGVKPKGRKGAGHRAYLTKMRNLRARRRA
jgi:hypothetical protein